MVTFLDHMTLSQIGSVALVVVGCVALVWLFRKFGGIITFLIVIAAVIFVSWGAILFTYHAFTGSTRVATIHSVAAANTPHTMLVDLTTYNADGTANVTKSYKVGGDAVMLQAQVIELQPLALISGMKSAYQLQKIEGEYDDASANSKSVSLGNWSWFTSFENNVGLLSPVIKSAYGNAIVVPSNGNTYDVYADGAGDLKL